MLGGLVTVLAGHLIETAKLKAYALALYAAAAASLLFASIFGLVALRHWIEIAYATAYPDLWIALAFVVIAVPLIGVGLYLQQQKPKTNPAIDIALLTAPSVLRLASRKISARAVVIGVVLVGGVALGRRFMARPTN
jgi:hypothetical protein